ncbi:MAG: BMP family ABC transporter substrate-binding protein [Lachnospiraceae bacterium]|nr:BMP family ABC transporter substrate-binding protein [Lachnospiraceae bacterium]
MKKLLNKVVSVALAGAMVLSMTACGSSASTAETAPAESAAAGTEAAAETTAATGDPLKITLCVGRTNDMSFQQSAYEGVMKVQELYPDQVEVNVVEMTDDTTKWEAAFYDAADAGADIIMGTGFQNLDNFTNIPQEYPDTKFILFDQGLDFEANELPNVMGVLFDSNQSGFLAGAVAAYYTQNENAANPDKTLGFVGAMEIVTITDFLVGYAEGARYVDPDMQIKTAYVGDFVDTAKAKDQSKAQIADGADIIFQVAGGAGTGVIEAASEVDGVMAIGVDADQYETMEDPALKEAVITSSLKRLDNAIVKIIGDYLADPASVGFGSNVTYGMEDDAVGIVFNDKLTESIGEENVANVQAILEKIKSGEITVDKASELTSDEINAIVAGE